MKDQNKLIEEICKWMEDSNQTLVFRLCEIYNINPNIKSIPDLKNEIKEKIIKNGAGKMMSYFVKYPGITIGILNNLYSQHCLSTLLNEFLSTKNSIIDKEFEIFKSSDKTSKDLNALSSKFQSFLPQELIAYRFFDCTYDDLLINLNAIDELYSNYKEELPKHLKNSCMFFINLKNMLLTCKYNNFEQLYINCHNKPALTSLLYDCMSLGKKIVANSICKSLTDFTKYETIADEVFLSQLKGYKQLPKMYDFTKKNFTCLVSTLNINRNMNYIEYVYRQLNEISNSDVCSVSLVSNKSLVTYHNMDDHITLCYFKINPDDILYVTERDNYNTYTRKKEYISSHRFAYWKPKDIMEYSKTNHVYNEINGRLNSKKITEILNTPPIDDYLSSFENPQGILCLEGPTDTEIKLANMLNIPIIIVSEKNYEFYGTNYPSTSKQFNYSYSGSPFEKDL